MVKALRLVCWCENWY